MRGVDRLRTIEELFCLLQNELASISQLTRGSGKYFLVGNKTGPLDRDSLDAHVHTTITHEVGSVFHNLTILVSHSHTVDVNVILTLCGMTILSSLAKDHLFGEGSAAIREGGSITILLHESLIIQLLVGTSAHNGSAIMSKANDFVVNSLALPQLTFEEIMVLLTELIGAVETTIKGVQDSTTSASYGAVVKNRSAMLFRKLLSLLFGQNFCDELVEGVIGSITTIKSRHERSTSRSTMQLTSNLDVVARLELVQMVDQLLSILMLKESRSRVLLLQLLACGYTAGLTVLLTRNILLTNIVVIHDSNRSTRSQALQIDASVCQTLNRQEQTIRLLAT